MNKESLNKRIGEINNELLIIRAHASKLEGHLSEVSHWLRELEKIQDSSSSENDLEHKILDLNEIQIE